MMIKFGVPIPTQLDYCLFHSWTVVALDIQPFSNRDVSLFYFWKVNLPHILLDSKGHSSNQDIIMVVSLWVDFVCVFGVDFCCCVF